MLNEVESMFTYARGDRSELTYQTTIHLHVVNQFYVHQISCITICSISS